jgi:hypothetical protein
METTQTNTEITSLNSLRAIIQDVTERQRITGRLIRDSAQRLGKQLSKLNSCFDKMVENMVMPDLIGKFSELGLVFNQGYRHTVIYDEEYNILTEVDITLENDDKVMIVEAKSTPSIENIADHARRMEILRLNAEQHGDRRIYLGAIAGMVLNEGEKQYALKNGFYVVELYEDTFVITKPCGG